MKRGEKLVVDNVLRIQTSNCINNFYNYAMLFQQILS